MNITKVLMLVFILGLGIYSMLLSGCTTVQKDYDDDILLLREDVKRLNWYITHEKCFISYNKCMVEKKQNCWPRHEQCVIAVYRMYKRTQAN